MNDVYVGHRFSGAGDGAAKAAPYVRGSFRRLFSSSIFAQA